MDKTMTAREAVDELHESGMTIGIGNPRRKPIGPYR